MATFLSDTFTDADATLLQSHTGETGATWTKHPSYAADEKVQTNRVFCDGVSSAYYASGVPATAEYDVEGVVRVLSGENHRGITGRMSTSANTMYLARYNFSTGKWELYKFEAGVATLLGDYAQALTNGNDYTVKLEIRDAAKKLYVDGVERVSSADNAITAAGRVGIRAGQATTTTGYHLDSITAADPPAASGGSRMMMGIG